MAASAEQVELWSSAAANAATVVAIIVGAWWTYSRVISQRTEQPRATLSYRAAHRTLSEETSLLRVSVRAATSGTVLLGVRELRCENPESRTAKLIDSGKARSEKTDQRAGRSRP